MAKTAHTFRFTLGEKRTKNFTKWHHLFVTAEDLESAREGAERVFRSAICSDMAPRHFLALRYDDGAVVEAWKFSYSSKEYEPYPLEEYLAEQVAFKERMVEKRRHEQEMSGHADAEWRRLFAQFAELAESVRTFLGNRTNENLKAVEEAVGKVTFV